MIRLQAIRKKVLSRKFAVCCLFIIPCAAFYVIFRYWPFLQSLFYSFFHYDYMNPPGDWAGFDNYINTFRSSVFWTSLWTTVKLFLLSLAFGFLVPILQALFLAEIKRGKATFRYMYLIPAGIPSIATLAVWKYIWNPQGGLANVISSALGFGTHDWLFEPNTALFALRFSCILGGGLGMMIYFVAINNIDSEIYSAAKIDGANGWQQMFLITIPNILDTIGIQFLLTLTSSLLTFDDVYILTGGAESSQTVVMGIYRKAFSELNMGQGMAMSVVIMLITLSVSIVQIKLQYRDNKG